MQSIMGNDAGLERFVYVGTEYAAQKEGREGKR